MIILVNITKIKVAKVGTTNCDMQRHEVSFLRTNKIVRVEDVERHCTMQP